MNKDFAIIGGGVIGLTLARELSKRGASVMVLDKNSYLASEASQAGGGIISPLHPWRYSRAMLDLASWSHNAYPQLAEELSFSSGIHVPIINTGMLVPDTSEASQALACDFLNAERVSAQEVSEIEPGLANPCHSVWVPEVNNIRNPALCKALIVDVTRRGVSLISNAEVQSIKAGKNQVMLDVANIGKVHVNKLVFAAGAWTSSLIKTLLPTSSIIMPEIYPVKGQMLAVKTHIGTVRTVILKDHHYIIPRHDGVVLVGSTVEYNGFNRALTEGAFEQLTKFAFNILPALEKCRVISQWYGFRPGVERDSPIISKLNGVDNVYVSAGHFRNGLLSAPASAKLMGDLLFNSDSHFDTQAYSL